MTDSDEFRRAGDGAGGGTDPLGPAEVSDLEERLRVALGQEAREIRPTDRLADIRARVGQEERRPGRPAWLCPLGAAAAVAAITAVAWLGIRPGVVTPPVAGTTSTTGATSTTAPSAVAPTAAPPTSAPPTTSARPTSDPTPATAPPATVSRALPVYFVEQVGATRWGLVREFSTQPVPVGADVDTLGAASVDLSVQGTPSNATTTVLDPWQPGTTSTVTTDGAEILVVLSQAGRSGLSAEQQRIAIQQVVWAVTAGVQQNRPVAITVRDSGPVFPGATAGPFKRPATDQVANDVAPIWVDSPSSGAVLPASSPVVVTGQACTFEANVVWRLEGGATVRDGATTASAACPSLGSWKVDLGTLAPGAYTFHAIEHSAADGSVTADQRVTFTVK